MSDELPDEGEILMGRWDCGSCGARGVLGDAYECSACGAPRPDDVTFYLPADAERITDAAGIAAAEAGADWQCAFCDSWMPATDGNCHNCGASVAESERRQREGVVESPGAGPTRATPVSTAPRGGGLSLGSCKLPCAFLGLLLLVAIIYGQILAQRRREHDVKIQAQAAVVATHEQAYRTVEKQLKLAQRKLQEARARLGQAQEAASASRRDAREVAARLEVFAEQAREVVVQDHAWTVRLELEQCHAQPGEGWERPPGAFAVQEEQRVHHTERVLDRVETRYRSERYKAQDGYDTETYTERVRAGTKRVRAGSTTKNLGNGRFKRVPKYRTETVYKTVRKTRKVPRYVWKTRQVPYEEKIYRDDPVHRPWYRYQTKVWRPAGSLQRSGQGTEVLEPEEAPPARPGDAVGTKRIARRTPGYSLKVRAAHGTLAQDVSVSPSRWRGFEVGAPALLVNGELLRPREHAQRVASLRTQLTQAQAKATRLAERVPPLEKQVPILKLVLPPLERRLAPLRKRLGDEQAKLRQLRALRP